MRVSWPLHARLKQTEAHAAADAIHRITKDCVSICEGATDALALLLDGNVLHDLYDFMQNSDHTTFLHLEAHQKPDIKVLEIGAGTGGTTATVLPALQSAYGERLYSSYSYTDVSAGFFPGARERFKGYAGIEYAILDISKNPLEQGFEPESFDFIVACNVGPPSWDIRIFLERLACLDWCSLLNIQIAGSPCHAHHQRNPVARPQTVESSWQTLLTGAVPQ